MAETSAAEMLDVVDADDQVVETLSRGEIHQRHLIHRSVHVLVFADDGRLLLQKRSMQKDECAGMWDTSCAGHVESGQSYAETAPRELEEELGFAPKQPLIPLFKMQPTPDNGMEFAMVYRTDYDGPFSIAKDEVDEISWFDLVTVDAWVRAGFRLIVQSGSDSGGSNESAGAEQPRDITSGFCEIWQRVRNLC